MYTYVRSTVHIKAEQVDKIKKLLHTYVIANLVSIFIYIQSYYGTSTIGP